jgi:hypothetical protein
MPNPFPRQPFNKNPKKYISRSEASRKTREDIEKLYAEVIEGEAIATLRLPGWEDAKTLIESGLAAMVMISRQEEDLEMAYKAAGFVIEFGQRAMERAGGTQGQEVMEQLRALYAKALPESSEPLVAEAREEEQQEAAIR